MRRKISRMQLTRNYGMYFRVATAGKLTLLQQSLDKHTEKRQTRRKNVDDARVDRHAVSPSDRDETGSTTQSATLEARGNRRARGQDHCGASISRHRAQRAASCPYQHMRVPPQADELGPVRQDQRCFRGLSLSGGTCLCTRVSHIWLYI